MPGCSYVSWLDLGVIIESSLLAEAHVDNITNKALFHLWIMAKIRNIMSRQVAEIFIALLAGCSSTVRE